MQVGKCSEKDGGRFTGSKRGGIKNIILYKIYYKLRCGYNMKKITNRIEKY
jgi:hypothetical protein